MNDHYVYTNFRQRNVIYNKGEIHKKMPMFNHANRSMQPIISVGLNCNIALVRKSAQQVKSMMTIMG